MKFKTSAHIAQRVFKTPLALHPDKALVIANVLAQRDGFEALEGGVYANSKKSKGYDLIGSIAVIPVIGTLVQKLESLTPESGMTGYNGIRANFFTAIADPNVKAIVFDIDSPGGEVSGCFDLVDAIYEARGKKPIWSILSESAYSAAYAIASAADIITVPRTGGTGSIGVIWMHADRSGELDKAGIKVTLVKFGALKAEGNEFSPLGEAQERIQAEINTMGELFVSTVSRNRGISADTVRATEAGTFNGAAGVELGLADGVYSPDAAFSELQKLIGDVNE